MNALIVCGPIILMAILLNRAAHYTKKRYFKRKYGEAEGITE